MKTTLQRFSRAGLAVALALCTPLLALANCSCSQISIQLEIKAVYPQPLEGENEWIQLFSTDSEEIDLSNYTLEDSTGKPQQLTGTLDPGTSIQIDDLNFQLNNGSDEVTLKGLDGTVMDQFSYSSSEAGVILEDSSISSEDNSANENSSDDDEAETETGTETPSLWPEFSEALPNPEGSDSTDEWIELYNPYDSALTLEGLFLDDQEGGSSPYPLSGSLDAYDYLVVMVTESQITLNNSFDSIRLIGVNDEVLWDYSYDDPSEGESLAMIDGSPIWTNQVTPEALNLAPSEDPGEDESDYENGDLSEDIDVTEVYPNPDGPDQDGEWIEITNGGDEAVNLGNWEIDDGEGGSSPYQFPDETVIQPGETLVIPRPLSKIALNNSNETVQLFDFTGELMSEIFYNESQEGKSYAKIQVEDSKNLQASEVALGFKRSSQWEWVEPSPGAANPLWQIIEGHVLTLEEGVLTLSDGLSEWSIQVGSSSLYETLLRSGNQVELQVSRVQDQLQLMKASLLQAAEIKEDKPLPWNLIGTLILVAAWGSYEAIKRRKLNELLPRSFAQA